MVIDEPHVEDQAHSSYASSVFSQIMGDILPYLNVFPTTDLPEEDQSIKSQLPQEAAKRVVAVAVVIIVGGGILNYFVNKRNRC